MKITRHRETSDYTVTPNAIYRDKRLSYRALGLLLYLLHLPDGWETDSAQLATDRAEGRDAIRTALRQLQDAGYVTRQRQQDPETGRWHTTMTVQSHPTNPQVTPKTENQAPDTHTTSTKPQVTPKTDFQSSETQSSGTRTSVSQALNQSTESKYYNPPAAAVTSPTPHANAHNRAAELNTNAVPAHAFQLLTRWHHTIGDPYPGETLTALARPVADLLTKYDPNLITEALNRWTTRPDARPGLLPHLLTDILKEQSGAGATLHTGPRATPQRASGGRESKAMGWLALGADSSPEIENHGPFRVIEGARTA